MPEPANPSILSLKSGAALMALLAAAFLLINRAAYQGYFQHDDFAHMSWCTKGGWTGFIAGAISPEFYPSLFRPLGHLHYYVVEKVAGLHFPAFVAAIHAYHLLASWVLWQVLRRLGFPVMAAASGVVFFAFNMATFRIFWNPAFVFDLGCGLLCLISLLHWIDRRWVASLICFFLAYRFKETAIMLPAVLALYELLLADKKQWVRLIPFFAISAWFGVQAVLTFRGQRTEYRFTPTAGAIWHAVNFYASRIFLIPAAGFGLAVAPALVRDRRILFGCASFWTLLLPMLLLSEHLNDTYLYVPMVGAVVALAGLFEKYGRYAVVGLFLLWIPFDYQTLRARRSEDLAEASENRPYIATLAQLPTTLPEAREFSFESSPAGLPDWGIESALLYFYPSRNLRLEQIRTDGDRAGVPPAPAVLLGWDPLAKRLHTLERRPDAAYPSYFRMNGVDPVWALVEGWHGADAGFRWSTPHATAMLQQPTSATEFRIEVILPNGRRETAVDVALDGVSVGAIRLSGSGRASGALALPERRERQVRVELTVPPEYRVPAADPRGLGAAIVSFGFVAGQ